MPNTERKVNQMSKISEMANIVEELRHAADVMNMAADFIYGSFCTDEPAEPETEEPKPVSLEMVRAVLADLSRAGHTAQIRELLQKYGADRLSKIDPAKYTELLREAEEIANAT